MKIKFIFLCLLKSRLKPLAMQIGTKGNGIMLKVFPILDSARGVLQSSIYAHCVYMDFSFLQACHGGFRKKKCHTEMFFKKHLTKQHTCGFTCISAMARKKNQSTQTQDTMTLRTHEHQGEQKQNICLHTF